MKIKPFYLIAACDLQNGIGRQNDLPWLLKQEYQHFQRISQSVGDPRIGLPIADSSTSSFYNQVCDVESLSETKEDSRELENKGQKNEEQVFTDQDQVQNHQKEAVHDGDALQNCLIMGRQTWQGIPSTCRPLKNRLNLVLSRSQTGDELGLDSKYVFSTLEEALEYASSCSHAARVFIVGGEEVYRNARMCWHLHNSRLWNVRL